MHACVRETRQVAKAILIDYYWTDRPSACTDQSVLIDQPFLPSGFHLPVRVRAWVDQHILPLSIRSLPAAARKGKRASKPFGGYRIIDRHHSYGIEHNYFLPG
jgi:hypothetical protein